MLTAEGLVAGYGGAPVLDGFAADLRVGLTALVGPNAAGKSTLLRCLAGVQPCRGRVAIDGAPVAAARHRIAYLPQDGGDACALGVFETVALGLLGELGWRIAPAQRIRILALLDRLGLAGLAGRRLDQLSGGQRQLVLIAQALIREPAAILLDEPTNHLDPARQWSLVRLLAELVRERGLACLIATHDLALAVQIADRMWVLDRGRLAADGPPATALTSDLLARVYGIDADLRSVHGRPWAVPRHPLRSVPTIPAASEPPP